MKIKTILTLFVLVLLFGVAAAEESGGVLRGAKGDCVELPQETSSASYCKLTKVQYPNLSVEIIDTIMTKNNSAYNYTFCNTDDMGIYSYCTVCDVDSVDTTACKPFEITGSGFAITTGSSILYVILLVVLFVVFLFFVLLARHTPYDNIGVDDMIRGKIITKVTKHKYIKLSAIWIASGAFLWMVVILVGMVNNYIEVETVRTMATGLYYLLTTLFYILSAVLVWLFFFNIWRDIVFNRTIIREGRALVRKL